MILFLAVFHLFCCLGGILGQETCENLDADVLIMGAGMAGITAAKTLYDGGVRNILILEGTDRIGGRIRDAEFSGVTIELGANWIQGVTGEGESAGDNPIWQLVVSGDCPLDGAHFDYDSFVAYEGMSNVTNVTRLAMEDYYEADDIIVELSEERRSEGLPDISVREAFENATTWAPSTNVENLVDWFLFDFCYAEPPENTSLHQAKPLATYESLGDYDYFVTDQRGFASLVQCIGQEVLLDDSVLKLNTNVTKIRWSDECVCAETVQPEGPRTYCGKFGIVTFSIGVLQQWVSEPEEEPNFQPPLPEAKTNAINAFSMAHYLKIFVNFTEAFWDTSVQQILRADDERGRFPHIQPLSLSQTDSMSNILILTVVENEATRILEQSENQTREEIMTVLSGIYGNGIPAIESILIPNWYRDPFFLGSYSNTPVGVDASAERELSSPEGNLFISGEVTDPDYNGFVHGAYLSGKAAAESVAEAISDDTSPTASPSPTPSGQPDLSPLLGFLEVLFIALLISANIM